MNDFSLPPIPPESPNNQRDPNEPSAVAKIGFVVAGIFYAFLTVFILGFSSENPAGNYLVFFLFVVLCVLPVMSLFYRGYRFFGLGVLLTVVFGCLIPMGAVFVICGRMGNLH